MVFGRCLVPMLKTWLFLLQSILGEATICSFCVQQNQLYRSNIIISSFTPHCPAFFYCYNYLIFMLAMRDEWAHCNSCRVICLLLPPFLFKCLFSVYFLFLFNCPFCIFRVWFVNYTLFSITLNFFNKSN